MYSNAEFKGKDSTIVSGVHEQISNICLLNRWMSLFSVLEKQHRLSSIFGVTELRVYKNTTHKMSPN